MRHIATEPREVISHSHSEYIAGQKREDLTNIYVLSSFFCLYMGLGLAHFAFDLSNAMLAL